MHTTLGQLVHVDPRTLWLSEPAKFTPWLADNLHLLGEAIGLDLELVQREAPVGDFCCDIEARETGSNRAVIIENQLDPTDHRHLGQLVTYAAGLDAAIIVWISPTVREEHRQALDWLNRHTSENIDFFGVSLEVIRIDQSNPAAQFRPVSFPNAWTKARSNTQRTAVSERALKYQEFFQKLLDELREKHRFTNARAAQPQNWYSFSSGVTGFVYSASFASGARLRAELYIDVGDAAENKSIYDWLLIRRAEFEEKMGVQLDWERLDARRACRIAAVRHNSSVDTIAAQGEELRPWLVEHLLKLKAIFGPILEDAAAAGAIQKEAAE